MMAQRAVLGALHQVRWMGVGKVSSSRAQRPDILMVARSYQSERMPLGKGFVPIAGPLHMTSACRLGERLHPFGG